MTINPVNVVSKQEKITITKGAKDELATISIPITSQMIPCPSLTGMANPITKAPINPIIDPMMLIFLFLKMKKRIRDEITIGSAMSTAVKITHNLPFLNFHSCGVASYAEFF